VTRCGFIAVIGRPNVGKSTLVNAIIGEKVSITSGTPNTTRHAIRGILTREDVQMVFIDTPGLHRATSTLGHRLNSTARSSVSGVDVVMGMIDATGAIGPGDKMTISNLLQACGEHGAVPLLIVNKADRAGREGTAAQLLAAADAVNEIAAEMNAQGAAARVEYIPTSATKNHNVDHLVDFVDKLMPEGPWFFPEDEVTDVPEAMYIAELVREQLFRAMRQELPHSIHCRVSEYEWPHITVEILVERESQKGMVIGAGGRNLKDVGIKVRQQMPSGVFLELIVKVEPKWQSREDVLDRFGY
jgi:GTP-binding protein Era